MRLETLKSPGLISNGVRLRSEASKAISAVEIVAGRTPGGKTNTAKTLSDFFSDCVSKLSGLLDAVLPTYASSLITAAAPTKLVITLSEDMDPGVIPAGSAFVSSPARTFSAVAVQGSKVTLTASAAFTANKAAPVQSAPSTATTGGTFAAGTYYIRVTALVDGTETVASNELSQVTTGATSTVTANWAAVTGATGYRIYVGTVAGAQTLYKAVGAVLTDTMTAAPSTAGSPPPGFVTIAYTQPGSNALRDLSGNLLATFAAQSVTNQVV